MEAATLYSLWWNRQTESLETNIPSNKGEDMPVSTAATAHATNSIHMQPLLALILSGNLNMTMAHFNEVEANGNFTKSIPEELKTKTKKHGLIENRPRVSLHQ